MKKRALYFTAPHCIEIREEPLGEPAPEQILVRTLLSGISAGTELLMYRGQAPLNMTMDETISSLTGMIGFPMKYGYAVVGEVIAAGSNVSGEWEGRKVFAFNPHESHFLAEPTEVLSLPPEIVPEEAVFFPNVETALTLVADGSPAIGEQIAVFGQGIVGLLVTSLLARLPLSSLVTLDAHPARRDRSLGLGAHVSVDPSAPQVIEQVISLLQGTRVYRGADLAFEVSGNPDALDQAIGVTGYNGRIVIGSWYGRKTSTLQLGHHFHRSRMRLISSQVSSIQPELRGRWSKERLQALAWRMIQELKPSHLVTHRFSLPEAARAYQLLDRTAEEALQVVLTY